MVGTYCVVSGCNSRTADKNIILFRFPNDAERSERWLIACNRNDLKDKPLSSLYKNYKVCAKHFEAKMFSSYEQNRLLPSAVPTIFPKRENFIDSILKRQLTHSESSEDEPSAKILILSDITIASARIATTPQLGLDRKSGNSLGMTKDAGTSSLQVCQQKAESPVASSRASRSVYTQTSKKLISNSLQHIKLSSNLKDTKRQLYHYKKLVSANAIHTTLREFDKMCDRMLPKSLAKFVQVQARFFKKKPKGRRFNMEYKQFALAFYFLGPRVYKFLEKIFCLPSKRCLERMTEKLTCLPGIENKAVYQCFKTKVTTLIEEDKHCLLCIGEMALKAHLFYNIERDDIVGFKDMGNGKRDFEAAQNATVIMARGLYNNWEQPIGYFFVGSTFPAEQLRNVLEDVIKKLTEIGLIVDSVATDMGSNFIQLANLLGVTRETPHFKVDNNDVIYIFDTPHLLKATRNNLLQNQFVFDGRKTSWSHIIDFYDKDKLLQNRIASKLTKSHLYPTKFEKTKINLAVEVLSGTIAGGINTYVSLGGLPADATNTVEIIAKFNKLFHILNTSIKNEPEQLDFLTQTCRFIKNLKVCNKKGDDLTNKMEFLTCWLITINGIKALWEKLRNNIGFQFLKTNRVNVDCLETFFENTRLHSGNRVNPTPNQFEKAYKKLFCQTYFHSNNTNGANDFDGVLSKLKDLNYDIEKDENEQRGVEKLSVNCDFRTQNLSTQNTFVYVCGYVINKSLLVHSCDVCQAYSNFDETLDIETLLARFGDYDNTKGIPHEQFLLYIYQLEILFFATFEEFCLKKHVGYSYLECMKKIDFPQTCPQFPLNYMLKLFIRFRIFSTLKFANRELLGKKNQSQKRKIKIFSLLE